MSGIFITSFLFQGCVAKCYPLVLTFFSLFVVKWLVRILCKKSLDPHPDVAEQDGIAHSASRASALPSQPLGAMVQQSQNIEPLTPMVPRALQFGGSPEDERGVNSEFTIRHDALISFCVYCTTNISHTAQLTFLSFSSISLC